MRTNWEYFKTELSEFGNTFINADHTDPNTAGNMFKNELNRLSSLHNIIFLPKCVSLAAIYHG